MTSDLPETLHGFHVGVLTTKHAPGSYSASNDATMGGISSRAVDGLIIVGILDSRGKASSRSTVTRVEPMPDDMQLYQPTEGQPAGALAVDHLFGDARQPRVTVVPVRLVERDGEAFYERVGDEAGHVMAGGNYAASTDSRWTRLVRGLGGTNHAHPVAIHDRIEPWR